MPLLDSFLAMSPGVNRLSLPETCILLIIQAALLPKSQGNDMALSAPAYPKIKLRICF